jgi:hypothetical protein
MKQIVLLLILIFSILVANAQKLSGQWTGGFNSGGNDYFGKTEYVLELDIKGTEVSGYSYTYFNIIGKRCYVICKLTGNYDKASKSVVVKEVGKVKSNTPPDFKDCFQTHTLTYLKSKDNKEVLVGKWKPATPEDNCGTGETELERKALVRVIPNTSSPAVASKSNPAADKTNSTAKATAPKKTPPPSTTKTTPPATAKTSPPAAIRSNPPANTKTTKPPAPPVAKKTTTSTPPVTENKNKPQTIEKNLPSIEKPKAPSVINQQSINKIDLRTKQVIRTVEVDSKTFKVDLYDNGQIDGDTISVYFNGKLMVSRQRLSTEPISITLAIDPSKNDNELVMYAENLGTIPPNTALMIVTVEGKRYEVNISSSEQTSGTVKFKLKEH